MIPPNPAFLNTLLSAHNLTSLCLAGTNGGVSFVGLLASAFGGFIVGCAYYLCLLLTYSSTVLYDVPPQWPVIVFATIGGFLGSLIDSLLGATLQYSGT